MEWRQCAFRTCHRSPDRKVRWKVEMAGESEVCEDHFRIVEARWPDLVSKSSDTPDARFADTPDSDPEPEPEVFEVQRLGDS